MYPPTVRAKGTYFQTCKNLPHPFLGSDVKWKVQQNKGAKKERGVRDPVLKRQNNRRSPHTHWPLLLSALQDMGCYSNMEEGHQIRRSLEKTEHWTFESAFIKSMDKASDQQSGPKACALKQCQLSRHYLFWNLKRAGERAMGRSVLLWSPKPRRGWMGRPTKT